MARLFDDASSEYLEIQQAIGGYPFAMTCLAKRDADIGVAVMALADKDVETHYFNLAIWNDANGNVVNLWTRAGVPSQGASTTSGITNNQWEHICAICASVTDRRVLLNAGSKGTSTLNINPANLDRTSIGRRGTATPPATYMSGDIAEAAIWDLSKWPGATAAIKANNFEKILPSLAKGFSPKFYPLGLKAYWDLGRGLNDRVGGYNLTASGTTVASHPKVIYSIGPQLTVPKKPVLLAGSIAIESGMTGALKVSRKLSGSVAIESGMTGALKVSRKLSGSIAIQSGVSGILTIQKENVRWSAGLFTFQGLSYEIAAGETNKKFIYWDPNYTTMFRATNDIQDVLNVDGWIMCIGESGVASPVFARKLIHGGIIQAGTITAEFGQIAALTVGTAEIKDLAVETLKVKDEAITVPASTYVAGIGTGILATLSFTTTGSKLFINGSVIIRCGETTGNWHQFRYALTVKRSGSTIYTTGEMVQWVYPAGIIDIPWSIGLTDTPAADTYSYTINLTEYESWDYLRARCRSLFIIETKK